MPVTANALLEAAKVLGRGETEADRRNAASRAYYAAYHRCLPVGRSVGLSAQPGQDPQATTCSPASSLPIAPSSRAASISSAE